MPNRICPCGHSVPKGEQCECAQARTAARDKQRPTPAQRGYDRDWHRLRAKHIAANPTCVMCGAPGEHVDHIETIRKAPHRRLDPTNLRTLCQPCHSRRTAREQRR